MLTAALRKLRVLQDTAAWISSLSQHIQHWGEQKCQLLTSQSLFQVRKILSMMTHIFSQITYGRLTNSGQTTSTETEHMRKLD